MKTVAIAEGSGEIRALLEQARGEDVISRLAGGSESMLSVMGGFDRESARTRTRAGIESSPVLRDLTDKLATYRGA